MPVSPAFSKQLGPWHELPDDLNPQENACAFSKELTEFPYDLYPNGRRPLGSVIPQECHGVGLSSTPFLEKDTATEK